MSYTKKENCPKKVYPSEHQEQRSFVSWWRKNFTELIFAVPNGGLRDKRTAAKMKLEGVTRGPWDICIPEKMIWIEFKSQEPSKKLSPEQIDFGERMRDAGYTMIAAWGCNDAIRQIKEGPRQEWQHWSKCGQDAPEEYFKVR